jgi:hypothetical protein
MRTTQTILEPRTVLSAQNGFQVQFMSATADIVIGGAAAGVGKSWCLLAEPMRHQSVPRFNCIVFRRTTEQIRNPGGLWDKSEEIYPTQGFRPNRQALEWFNAKTNVTIKFSHLQYEKDTRSHDGAEYCLICFDELQHFTKKQFLYLLSRNRSTCGVRPYMMCTCNPDPDSFLSELLEWWIDQVEKHPDGSKNPHWGYPIADRIGKIRYFIVHEDKFIWADSKDELIANHPNVFAIDPTRPQGEQQDEEQQRRAAHMAYEKDKPEGQAKEEFIPLKNRIDPHNLIKSLTFITGSIFDNKMLLQRDPAYIANLMAQEESDRLRLLLGNWKVRLSDDCIFTTIAITNMFDNPYETNSQERFITCDAARFGDDLCTIFLWSGWRVIKLLILTKSSANDIVDVIERERTAYNIKRSRVIIDQDGVGGGVVKLGKYIGFQGNQPVMQDPGTYIKENYFNQKSQFAYRFAEHVNADDVSVALSGENILVDNHLGCKIKIGEKIYDVRDLIRQDFKAIRHKNPDRDGRKKINSKEEQKHLLGGRSPDFFDGMYLRIYWDFRSGATKVGSVMQKRSLLDFISEA